MRRKVEPLLCELHAHTRWSDGAFLVPELVDLYGRNGFDVLCITDHVNRTDDPWLPADAPMRGVHAANHADYLAEIEAQAERARREYDLLLLPGIELTYNDLDPFLAAHAVAIGCRAFVSVDGGLDAALARARGEGAALVAAHPYGRRRAAIPSRTTQRFFREWRALRELVDRWELFNRYELFGWVAERGLAAVASGDFHRAEHLYGWKTLLPCAKRRARGRRLPLLAAAGLPDADRRRGRSGRPPRRLTRNRRSTVTTRFPTPVGAPHTVVRQDPPQQPRSGAAPVTRSWGGAVFGPGPGYHRPTDGRDGRVREEAGGA